MIEMRRSALIALAWACSPALIAAADVSRFAAESRDDRLIITDHGRPVAEFVFRDPVIKRPYLANVRTPGGIQVTRRHPPVVREDAVDHDTMHPGIWIGFGSLNGEDFWRNKGTIRHDRFSQEPRAVDGGFGFTAESTLLRADGTVLGHQTLHVHLARRERSYVIRWDCALRSETVDLKFGDQEEMGLGVRMATPITEKAGGRITSADGRSGAKTIWGTLDKSVDYSGTIDGKRVGVTIVPAADNLRRSWWHTRDYGVFVANPFGKRSVSDGSAELKVPRGETLRLCFTVEVHEES